MLPTFPNFPGVGCVGASLSRQAVNSVHPSPTGGNAPTPILSLSGFQRGPWPGLGRDCELSRWPVQSCEPPPRAEGRPVTCNPRTDPLPRFLQTLTEDSLPGPARGTAAPGLDRRSRTFGMGSLKPGCCRCMSADRCWPQYHGSWWPSMAVPPPLWEPGTPFQLSRCLVAWL